MGRRIDSGWGVRAILFPLKKKSGGWMDGWMVAEWGLKAILRIA